MLQLHGSCIAQVSYKRASYKNCNNLQEKKKDHTVSETSCHHPIFRRALHCGECSRNARNSMQHQLLTNLPTSQTTVVFAMITHYIKIHTQRHRISCTKKYSIISDLRGSNFQQFPQQHLDKALMTKSDNNTTKIRNKQLAQPILATHSCLNLTRSLPDILL